MPGWPATASQLGRSTGTACPWYRCSRRCGSRPADRSGPAEEARVRDRTAVRGRGLPGAVRLDPPHPRVRARRRHRQHESPHVAAADVGLQRGQRRGRHVAEVAADRQHLPAAVQDVVLREPGRVGAEQGVTGWRLEFQPLDRPGEGGPGGGQDLVVVRGLRRLERGVKRAQPADDAAHRRRGGQQEHGRTGERDRGQVPGPADARSSSWAAAATATTSATTVSTTGPDAVPDIR